MSALFWLYLGGCIVSWYCLLEEYRRNRSISKYWWLIFTWPVAIIINELRIRNEE
jgi:hypothetical protein